MSFVSISSICKQNMLLVITWLLDAMFDSAGDAISSILALNALHFAMTLDFVG